MNRVGKKLNLAAGRLFLLFLLTIAGCDSTEEGSAPDIIELTPNPVVAGDISTVSFRLQPNSNNDRLTWSAVLTPDTVAGGFLDHEEGTVRPMEQVFVHFHSKNPTGQEDATTIFSAWDPEIPLSSTNKGRLYPVYIKVIPAQ